jgi:hypothetical protein
MANIINRSQINTNAGLGDTETTNDPAFIARPWLQHSYVPRTPCASLPHHWAELKTSILVNMLIQENLKGSLVNFETGIILRIYEALPGPVPAVRKFQNDFEHYVSQLGNATQNRLYDPYPVAQSQNFVNQANIGSQDPLLLFNFIKHRVWGRWMTGGFDPNVDPNGAQYQGDFHRLSNLNWMNPANCNDATIRQTLVLNSIQPNLYNFVGGLRGGRDDFPRAPGRGPQGEQGEVMNRVGITHLDNQNLRRTLPAGINPTVAPWQHPGNSQCKMPYRGKWGEKIRIAREQQSVWASYMCGVSGSTSFFLWSYLMSITNVPYIANPTQDIHNVFILAAVVLAGDGGHNIREVVYGLALFFCILFNFFSVIETELKQIMGNQDNLINNLDFILAQTSDCIRPLDMVMVGGNPRIFTGTIIDALYNNVIMEPNNGTLANLGLNCTANSNPVWLRPGTDPDIARRCAFGLFLRGLRNISPAVLAGYTETKHMNITGMNQNDMDVVINGPNPFGQLQTDLARSMVGLPTINFQINPPNYNLDLQYGNQLQVFLALENNRYLNENWEFAADNFMEMIIRSTYPNGNQIMNLLNDQILQAYRNCSEGVEPMEEIPFAFPGSKPRRQKKKSKMPEGNVGYNKHIQKGERILQEEAERDSYYRTTQHEMEGEEKFTARCIKFNARALEKGYPTLDDIRQINAIPED